MRKSFYPAIILISLVWLFFFRPLFLGGPASYIIVNGTSMEPTLYNGDLAVMQRRASYSVGEVVAFRVPGGNVIHRIVGGSAEEGFVTQGDNKPAVDPWQPMPEDILGRLWFHIPEGGRPLQKLRQPSSILALGGLAAFIFLEESRPERSRKRGRRMKGKSNTSGFRFTPPSWTLNALGAAAVLGLLFAAAAVYGFLLPAERIETVERLRYDHVAAFQYTVRTEPSLLYPQETIGPIGPESAAAGDLVVPVTGSEAGQESGGLAGEAGPPVFTRLAHSLDLDFAYQLSSQSPAEVQGQVGVDLQIKAGEGWVKTQNLVPPAPFEGPSAEAHASLDLPQILAFLEAVEEQTGYDPGTYELAIIPTVRLSGQIDGQAVEETYAPAFTLTLDQTQIRLDPELMRSEAKRVEEPALQPNQIRLLGLSLPVHVLRLAGLAGAVPCLLACLLLAAVYAGIGQDEAARFKARYGGLIVPVAGSDLDARREVQVASMPDLARLAQREGSLIFHQSTQEADLYFVPDGQAVYTYRVDRPGAES